MKRYLIFISLLISLSLACSFMSQTANGVNSPDKLEAPLIQDDTEPPQSEQRCGDKVCDGPENAQNCPEDCRQNAPATDTQADTISPPAGSTGEYSILYQISENSVTSFKTGNDTCYAFNFRQFLDGGQVQIDGSANQILDLKDYPTSQVTAKTYTDYYYISTPNNHVSETHGFEVFNWEVPGHNLWAGEFGSNNPRQYSNYTDGTYPANVTTAPGNRYLLFPLSQTTGTEGFTIQNDSYIPNYMNPFDTDSSLVISSTQNKNERHALNGSYNHQLFISMADFSADGNSFFTLSTNGDSFQFVKIALDSGSTSPLSDLYPGFDWNSINWNEFFSQANDFAYGHFTISPDETRIVAFKNIFTVNMENPCVTDAAHNLWIFDLENNKIERFQNIPGYISDTAWKFDSSEIAMAILENAGCYPEYMDAKIELMDKNGKKRATLVNELQSKITNIGWAPDGGLIAFDVYSTDSIGRIKTVDPQSKQISEVINTQNIGYQVNPSQPVTLLFADWVSSR